MPLAEKKIDRNIKRIFFLLKSATKDATRQITTEKDQNEIQVNQNQKKKEQKERIKILVRRTENN